MLLFRCFSENKNNFVRKWAINMLPFSCLRKPVCFEAPSPSEHTGYLLYTDLLCLGWTMLNENNSKGLFCIPEFLDILETQLECLAFPDPKLQLPTVIGTESKATPEGRGPREGP